MFDLSSAIVAPAPSTRRTATAVRTLHALPDTTDVQTLPVEQATSHTGLPAQRTPADGEADVQADLEADVQADLEADVQADVQAGAPAFPPPSAAARSLTKALLDRCGAALLLLLLLPLMLVVALAVRLSSPGPAIYRQRRIGLSGQPFTIWKFRTMAVDADEHLVRLLLHHGRSATPLFKVPNDPRITQLGRYLRISSIDELPQLVNVLRGQMSLVGPRPQCPDEVAMYTAEEMDRLSVRPGLTGLWQVSGRSAIGWDEAVAHDLEYVRSWDLGLDVRIMLRTVSVVAHGHGAS